MSRLSQEDMGIIGIDFDKGPVVKKSVWNPIKKAWEGLDISASQSELVGKAKRSQDGAIIRALASVGITPRQAIYGAGGLTIGVLLGAVAFRRSGTKVSEPTAAPLVAKEPVKTGASLTVKTPKKHQPGTLRPSPSLNTKPLGYLQPGTVVKVLSHTEGTDGHLWYQIQPPVGQAGWMHGDILS